MRQNSGFGEVCEGREALSTAGQETGGTTDLHPGEYKSLAGGPGLEAGATITGF